MDETTGRTVLKYCAENVIFYKQIALSEWKMQNRGVKPPHQRNQERAEIQV